MCTDENNEIQRPFICNNIIAFNKAQGDPYQGYEVPLFTDAKIIGDIDNPKFPYQIFNCRSFPYQTIEQPSIVLRIWRFITANEEMLPMIGKEAIRRLKGPSVRIRSRILECGHRNTRKTKRLFFTVPDTMKRPVPGWHGNLFLWGTQRCSL